MFYFYKALQALVFHTWPRLTWMIGRCDIYNPPSVGKLDLPRYRLPSLVSHFCSSLYYALSYIIYFVSPQSFVFTDFVVSACSLPFL